MSISGGIFCWYFLCLLFVNTTGGWLCMDMAASILVVFVCCHVNCKFYGEMEYKVMFIFVNVVFCFVK